MNLEFGLLDSESIKLSQKRHKIFLVRKSCDIIDNEMCILTKDWICFAVWMLVAPLVWKNRHSAESPWNIPKKKKILFFYFIIAHSFIEHMGSPSSLPDRKGSAIYSRLGPEQPSQNLCKCIDWICLKKIPNPLASCMQRVRNRNYSYYLKDEIHIPSGYL
jgi:hypothetical protein